MKAFKNYNNSNAYGLIVSLLFHILLMLIPLTITVSKDFKEIELFFIDERVIEREENKVIKPKKEVLRDFPISGIKQDEIQEKHIPKEIEPIAITTNEETKTIVITKNEDTFPPISAEKNEIRPLQDVEFGTAMAPSFLKREMPVYPMIARRLGKEGRVLMRLTIDDKGNLLNVDVIEGGGYGFTESAVEAVKKSTFRPAIKDGKPVMSKALLSIKFSLKNE